MKNRLNWGISLVVFALLLLVSLYPRGFSQDILLSPVQDADVTPVSEIQANRFVNRSLLMSSSEGLVGVDAIRAMKTATSTAPDSAANNPHKPVSYTPAVPSVNQVYPMPTFAVFPVVMHESRNKAFSDLPVVLSSAVAVELEQKHKAAGMDLPVMNPIYAYDELKAQGLDGLYHKVMKDYTLAGQPNERDLSYLVKQLGAKNRKVQWVVFVQADFDMNQTMTPYGRYEKARALLWEKTPKEPNYLVKGNVQIYNVDNGLSLVWNQEAQSRVQMSSFNQFSRSVLDDSDTAYNFKNITRQLAQNMMASLPAASFATVSTVQGNVMNGASTSSSTLTPEDQETLKRILNE